ncbi:hypothetical protein FJ950_15000 [Mesorhizobium sp. B2-3-14]|uniref:hypothetical protein n=1 Tax=Mesorhizobium sp. B2-3-14 TaxID=2589950 RepID=UPI0011269F4A|nr:hypothetical protein [Mesorhizobium sp. B2-3-14]TPL84676.1 hypothetical protein FJ950_15000 [Mesorhizobium sp. B2-3-14]
MLSMLLKALVAATSPDDTDCDFDTLSWLTDPLAHPALGVMSERELGDVPFRLTARRTAYEAVSPSAGFGDRC